MLPSITLAVARGKPHMDAMLNFYSFTIYRACSVLVALSVSRLFKSSMCFT
jgi:hypothetical protein